ALRDALRQAAPAGVHNAQPGALSITQATETGAAYSPSEIRELSGLAHEAQIPVHMDGSRLANALARQKVRPAEMTWKAGIDVLSLGATKNGALGVEAVVLFDPAQAWEFELRRKRGGHLFSKMRFLAAQMEAYLTDGLWLRLAEHANRAADRLASGLIQRGVRLIGEIGANILFAEISLDQHRTLQAAGAHYYTMSPFDADGAGDQLIRVRLVTNFSTRDEEIERFLATFDAG
ncbi:MAG TPA: beta-eliminating lyase-related protein, partial [Paracoccaceae bacterium]|nr:beta-eliminating lyase-related protein [Paracoccaceae bacterium]